MRLTIAIPYFNSGKYIGGTLESIVREVSFDFINDVEILLIDNCSDDNSTQVVNRVLAGINYRLHINERNFGVDFSLDWLARNALGEYVWFLGSQDKVLPGAVRELFNNINDISPTNFLLNFSVYDEILDKVVTSNHYQIEKNQMVFNRYDFFRKFGGPALTMSANVVRSDLIKKQLDNKLVGLNWALYERLVGTTESPLSDPKVLVIAKPMFELFRESDGWWTTSLVFLNYLNLIKVQSEKVTSFKTKCYLRYRFGGKSLCNSIKQGKLAGLHFTLKIRLQMLRYLYYDPRFWFVALPLTFFPVSKIRPVSNEY